MKPENSRDSHLIVDGNVAVGQREARGGRGGQRGSGEMDGVLVQGVKHAIGGPTVTHVHDLKAGLHPEGDESISRVQVFGSCAVLTRQTKGRAPAYRWLCGWSSRWVIVRKG